MKNFLKNTKGFMTIEMLISISIITIFIFFSMQIVQKSMYLSRQALHITQSAYLLEEGGEAMRIIRDNNWDNISSLDVFTDYYFIFSDSTNTWSLSTVPNNLDIFTRKVEVKDVYRDSITNDIVENNGIVDFETKLIIISVSWKEGEKNFEKKLFFYLSNIFS